jgi:hypothetical protein
MSGFSVTGTPSATFRLASTNDVQRLTAAKLVTAGGKRSKRAVVAVETNSVRVAWGTDPTQGAGSVGVTLNNGDVLTLESPAAVEGMRFLSAVAGTHGVLQVSVEF